jgi:hypothetical protein
MNKKLNEQTIFLHQLSIDGNIETSNLKVPNLFDSRMINTRSKQPSWLDSFEQESRLNIVPDLDYQNQI